MSPLAGREDANWTSMCMIWTLSHLYGQHSVLQAIVHFESYVSHTFAYGKIEWRSKGHLVAVV
jgi:hypothetical protein